MRRHGYVRLSKRAADPPDRRSRRMRAPSVGPAQRTLVTPSIQDSGEVVVKGAAPSRKPVRVKVRRPSASTLEAARSEQSEPQVEQPKPYPDPVIDLDRQPAARVEPQASLAPDRDVQASPLDIRRRGRRPRPSRTTTRFTDGRYDQLGLSDWSYEQPPEVVSDPDQAEVDRLLRELFPRTNGGVQNHFYSDPNMPPVSRMPEVHPEAEIVLDILDGAYLPARVAAALQERRARREEKARLEAEEARRSEAQDRLEEVIKREREALRAAKARSKAEVEEARKAAQVERQQRARKAEEARKSAQAERRRRADEVVRAAAEADRERIADEEAGRKDQRRLASEASRHWQASAAADAERRGVDEEEARHAEERRLASELAKAGAEADRERIAGELAAQDPGSGRIGDAADLAYYPSARDPSFESYYQLLCKIVVFRAYPSVKAPLKSKKLATGFFEELDQRTADSLRNSVAWQCYRSSARALLINTEDLVQAERSYAVECVSRLTSRNGREFLRRRLDDLSQAIAFFVSEGRSVQSATKRAADRSALLSERHPFLYAPRHKVVPVARVEAPQPVGRPDPASPDAVAGSGPRAVGSRGRRSGRPDRIDEKAGNASITAATGSPPQAKAWSAPVVVPAPIQAPEVPSSASAAAEPVSRSEHGGRQNRADNVVQFPGPKRTSPGPGTLQPDADAAKPKRRGRPPGSKNRVRPPELQSATAASEAKPPTGPVSRTTDAVSPAPALRPLRRLSSSAYPLLTASFPLPSWRSINALRDSWSRSLPYDTDVLEQARTALPPDCIRWRVRNGEVSFSEIVASVMTAGGQGTRLLLFHDVHLGVAAIDVRCPRPQLVERWSRCIDAAKASLPAGCEMPSYAVMDQVQRLRVDLTVSTLVECLWEIGLGVAVGSVES